MWKSPLGDTFELRATEDPDSHKYLPEHVVGIPLGPHPGSWGFVRKNHVHEGVDLYVPHGTPVFAVEPGVLVKVENFTGAKAIPPSPWWGDTEAVFVEGASGVVVYGEVETNSSILGAFLSGTKISVKAGELLGYVSTVLKVDKGRPMSMLHLELHTPGTVEAPEWPVNGPKPATNLDPTSFLLDITKVSL